MNEADNLFVNTETVTINASGFDFQLKPVTGGDELDWIDDYTELKEEQDASGQKIIVARNNLSKLSLCKLRNIVGVPFSEDKLKELGFNKPFDKFDNSEKDAMFVKLPGTLLTVLIKEIDALKRSVKKKD